ncbi:GNAT family N-acetyltransferase [Guptibacillus algicola]|uniref:GNAT family N-acetyltransferase n=1 Tax=Guptibacillus algicola TaxID=225844 RepID=UPI001CD602D8|nr:GNAT family N-acetyltransferase [Alkalihalobacillus algicola]MCA0987563.1 GNAT family N-acetyltransferase [Alkalihalobacillus algicola]
MLPILKTERLILRERTMRDLEFCIEMDRDKEVVRYVDGPWDDEINHRAFVTKRIKNVYPKGMGYWMIETKDQEIIGWMLLIPVDAIGPEIEIGWRLKQEYWGSGYATEAAKPLVQHAFETTGIEEIVADIHPSNKSSIHVAEKIGLTFERLQYEESGIFHRYSINQEQHKTKEKSHASI